MARRPVITRRSSYQATVTRTLRRAQRRDERFIKLFQRDLVRRGALRIDGGRFVVHRRGAGGALVGLDPLEARAVPQSRVRGTLPERIFYRALLARRMVADIDFSFQSSLQGGRLELGGMVADFLFPARRLVVRIQGYKWHTGVEVERRDDEQRAILETLGYAVLDIWDYIILDEPRLDAWLVRNIDVVPTLGGHSYFGSALDGDLTVTVAQELRDRVTLLERALLQSNQNIQHLTGMLGLNGANPHIQIGTLGIGERIVSPGFQAGVRGFEIQSILGDAEFGNITARGEIRSTSVAQSTAQATSGIFYVTGATDVLIRDVAAADTAVQVKTNAYKKGDLVLFQPDGSRVEWMQVTDTGTAVEGGFEYAMTRDLDATGANIFYKGEVGVKLGGASVETRSAMWAENDPEVTIPEKAVDGLVGHWGTVDLSWAGTGSSAYGGGVRLDGTDVNGPLIGIIQRNGPAYNDYQDYVRLGNMAGFADHANTRELGWGAGDVTNFISWVRSLGLRIKAAGGTVTVDADGIHIYDDSNTEIIRLGNLASFLDYSATRELGIGVGSGTNFMAWDATQGMRIQGTQLFIEDDTYPSVKSTRTTTATTGIANSLQLKAKTSGDMADNFGAGMRIAIEDSAGVSNDIAAITGLRNGADNVGMLSLGAINAGTQENTLRIFSSEQVAINESVPDGDLTLGVDGNKPWFSLFETTDPGSAPSQRARVYARASGGKTQLVVVFQSGAEQVLATEP